MPIIVMAMITIHSIQSKSNNLFLTINAMALMHMRELGDLIHSLIRRLETQVHSPRMAPQQISPRQKRRNYDWGDVYGNS